MRLVFLTLKWKEAYCLLSLLEYLEIYNFEDVNVEDIDFLRSATRKIREAIRVI